MRGPISAAHPKLLVELFPAVRIPRRQLLQFFSVFVGFHVYANSSPVSDQADNQLGAIGQIEAQVGIRIYGWLAVSILLKAQVAGASE